MERAVTGAKGKGDSDLVFCSHASSHASSTSGLLTRLKLVPRCLILGPQLRLRRSLAVTSVPTIVSSYCKIQWCFLLTDRSGYLALATSNWEQIFCSFQRQDAASAASLPSRICDGANVLWRLPPAPDHLCMSSTRDSAVADAHSTRAWRQTCWAIRESKRQPVAKATRSEDGQRQGSIESD